MIQEPATLILFNVPPARWLEKVKVLAAKQPRRIIKWQLTGAADVEPARLSMQIVWHQFVNLKLLSINKYHISNLLLINNVPVTPGPARCLPKNPSSMWGVFLKGWQSVRLRPFKTISVGPFRKVCPFACPAVANILSNKHDQSGWNRSIRRKCGASRQPPTLSNRGPMLIIM